MYTVHVQPRHHQCGGGHGGVVVKLFVFVLLRTRATDGRARFKHHQQLQQQQGRVGSKVEEVFISIVIIN